MVTHNPATPQPRSDWRASPPHREEDVIMRTALALLVLLVAGPTLADESPASSGQGLSAGQVLKRFGSDAVSAGRQLGHGIADAGRQAGRGAAAAAKRNGAKIASDVKTRNFALRNNGKPDAPRGQGAP
jgi:hypothetical protein